MCSVQRVFGAVDASGVPGIGFLSSQLNVALKALANKGTNFACPPLQKTCLVEGKVVDFTLAKIYTYRLIGLHAPEMEMEMKECAYSRCLQCSLKK